MKRFFAAAAVGVLTIGGATAVGGAGGTQNAATVARQFLGTWRLISWTVRAADGSTRPGQTDAGYLIYTDVNRMCAVMMDSKRPKWAAESPKSVDEAMAPIAWCFGSIRRSWAPA